MDGQRETFSATKKAVGMKGVQRERDVRTAEKWKAEAERIGARRKEERGNA